MPSNNQPPPHRRGRSRQQLQAHQVEKLTHQVEELTKRTDEQNRRAEEQDRRWFMLNVIITLGGGWLFWRLPRQPQGRDFQVSGDTRHDVRGGGNPRITPPQDVSIRDVDVSIAASAQVDTSISAEVVPAEPHQVFTIGKSKLGGPDTLG